MKKSGIIGISIAIVVVAAVGTIIFANRAEAPDATMDMSKSNMSTTAKPSAATSSNQVTIENFAFSSNNITVKKGTTVTWTNKDSATHNVTETDGKNGPKSGDLATGKSFVFTFDEVGTYKYDCSIHPNMTGTVTVTE